ncbi:recombinase family protein [Mediterraneibacter gnavus]|jgi:DNA invertase Pin-like site-specific DNA recombinase|uniref:Recombinase family protein n=1 Tax=Mediterraneibacter gnavus TaxID=33038 RepID=A0A412C1W3_MEDGN|nr:recombinase family protein [Mediterraneibacter gnavus]RGQ67099.1 recombinase family protein [Mediterraneibacter gnavus]
MAYYGYHRTSTKEQHLDRGIIEIQRFCESQNIKLTGIFTDKLTGKNFDRPRYTVLVEDVLREGDTLIITELDRLGRNKQEILKQLQSLKDKGVRVMVLELPTTLIDLSQMDNALARLMIETINNVLIEIYASLAQAEMEKKEKRQREGMEAKKLRGEWDEVGRPRAIEQEKFNQEFIRVVQKEVTPTQLQRELGLTSSTYYRYRKNFYDNFPEFLQFVSE